MTSELKPCPWCGVTPRGVRRTEADLDGVAYVAFTVQCLPCGFGFMARDLEEDCVSAWNRRAPSEAVGLLREALRLIDPHVDGTYDLDDKIRRFLAAQEGT